MTDQREVEHTPSAAGGYGIDAPYVPLGLGAVAAVLLVLAIVFFATGTTGAGISCLIAGATFAVSTAIYMHTTLRGKFACWRKAVRGLRLSGSETVLDVGCGRGAVLAILASAIPHGKAVGVDLWRQHDQSGNDRAVTEANVTAAAPTTKLELETADMTKLPFPDASFDVVSSNAAVHNLSERDARRTAIREMARVARPGGRVLVADIRNTGDYREDLEELGFADVHSASFGWQAWYGGPWMATRLVSATKPPG